MSIIGSGNDLSGAMGNPIDPTADRMGSFAQIVKAMGDYNLETAQASLAQAQADLAEAQANREQIGNEELQMRVERMQRQQELLDAAQRQAAKDAKTANEHLGRILQLEMGGRTNRWIFYSLDQMLQIIGDPEVIQRVMWKPTPAFGPENFALNGDSLPGVVLPVEGCPAGNVGGLILFAQNNKYQFAPYSVAHMTVVEALAALSDAAKAKAAAIEAKMVALRDQPIAPLPTPGGNVTGATPSTELKKD